VLVQIFASFGRLIKERRKALDLTQEELARQVGCAIITIKKIEAETLRCGEPHDLVNSSC
jgi:transcriptional regulator with XRE-family HTH domain